MTGDDNALIAATLAQLVKEVSNIGADLRGVGERIGKVEDIQIRFDERQRGWATKQEVSESAAALRAELQPIDARTTAMHRRMDEFSGSLDEAVKAVRDDFKERDERYEAVEARLNKVELTLAKAAGLAGGGGILGGIAAALIQKLGG